MADPKTNPQPQQPEGPLYPAIESFIERATPEEVAGLFTPIKEGLSGLRGPKAENAKKVQRAIAAAEELLKYLLEVRERLEAERRGGARARK
ncbi:MAG: hypothetical protein HYZ28_01180 [Myxococcales bacterium]|nr:hypothetical protein [Myxococcales bacterium]